MLEKPSRKKMFSFGHCPNEGGGGGLARIKKYTLYIPLWRPKKMYKLPERRGGGGGEGIWAMPERKHFFFHEVFPNIWDYMWSRSWCRLFDVITGWRRCWCQREAEEKLKGGWWRERGWEQDGWAFSSPGYHQCKCFAIAGYYHIKYGHLLGNNY